MAELSPVGKILRNSLLGPEWWPWEVWHPPATVIQVVFVCGCCDLHFTTTDPSFFAEIDGLPEAFRKLIYWRLTGIGKQCIEGLDR